MLIDSVFSKKYYSQVFLEEWKYIFKEKIMIRFITDDQEISSSGSDKQNSAKED